MLSPWDPLDHLRLLWWVFFAPARLAAYHEQHGKEATDSVGAWLASTLVSPPLLIPALDISVGTLPRGLVEVGVAFIVAAGMLVVFESPATGLGAVLRGALLVALILSLTALAWLCLLGGWRVFT